MRYERLSLSAYWGPVQEGPCPRIAYPLEPSSNISCTMGTELGAKQIAKCVKKPAQTAAMSLVA
jgi:hypothetical protein